MASDDALALARQRKLIALARQRKEAAARPSRNITDIPAAGVLDAVKQDLGPAYTEGGAAPEMADRSLSLGEVAGGAGLSALNAFNKGLAGLVNAPRNIAEGIGGERIVPGPIEQGALDWQARNEAAMQEMLPQGAYETPVARLFGKVGGMGPLALAAPGGPVAMGALGATESLGSAGERVADLPPEQRLPYMAAQGAIGSTAAVAPGKILGRFGKKLTESAALTALGESALMAGQGTATSVAGQQAEKIVDPNATTSIAEAVKEGVDMGLIGLGLSLGTSALSPKGDPNIRVYGEPSKESKAYFEREQLNAMDVKQRPEAQARQDAAREAAKVHEETHQEMLDRVRFEHKQTLERLRADPDAQALAQQHSAAETTTDKVETWNQLHEKAGRYLTPQDVQYIAGERDVRPDYAYDPTRSEGFAWKGNHHNEEIPKTSQETPEVPPRPDEAAPIRELSQEPLIKDNGDWSLPNRRINNKLYESMVQEYDPILRIERELRGTPKEMGPIARVLALAPGKSARKIEEMQIRAERELIQPMLRAGIPLLESAPGKPSAREYIYSLGAEQGNATLAAKFPDEGLNGDTNPGMGMSNADAARIRAEAENGPHADTYKQIAEFVRKANVAKLDERQYGGELSAETRAQWEKDWGPYHAPNKTIFDPEDPTARPFTRQRGVGAPKQFTEARTGRAAPGTNPLASIMADYGSAAIQSELNRAALTVRDLVLEYPNSKVWEVYKNEKAIPREDADNKITIKDGGKTQYIVVRDPATRDALKKLNVYKSGEIEKWIGRLSRTYAMLNTGHNPSWPLANWAADYPTALANIFKNKGLPIGKATKVIARMMNPAGMGTSLKAIAEVEWGGKIDGLTDAQKSYIEARRAGVGGGFIPFSTAYQHSVELQRAVADVRRDGWRAAKPMFHAALRQLELAGKLLENITRHRTYEAMRAEGFSVEESASVAQQATFNPNQKGSWGAFMNTHYVLSGGATKGIAATLRDIHTPRGAVVAASMIAAAFMYSRMRRQLDGQDENGRDTWDTKSARLKETGLLLPLYMEQNGKAVDLWAPVPRGIWAVLWTAGTQVEAAFNSPNWTPGKAALETLNAASDQLNPLGGSDAAQSVVPWYLRPATQAWANKDWNGNPIRPEAKPWSPSTPEHMLFWGNTPEGVVSLSKAMSEMTGGNDVTKGAVEVSPNMIEHWIQAATGGAGQDVFGVARNFNRMVSGRETLFRDWPVMKRFLKETDPIYTGRGIFYDNANEIEHAKIVFDDAVKKGDAEYIARAKDSPALQMYGALQKFRASISDLNKASEATTDPEQKKALAARAHSLTTQFNRFYESRRRGQTQ